MTTPAGGRRWSSALRVTASQMGVAGSSYLVLALSGRVLEVGQFAALTSFYLVLNVLGRGVLSAPELELTRSFAATDDADPARPAAARAGLRHTAVLAVLAVLGVVAAAPVLLPAVDGDVVLLVLLAAGMPGLALSYLVRGPLAGTLRYPAYARTYFVEAAVVMGTGVGAAVLGATDARVWAAGMAAGPLVGAAAVLGPRWASARALLRAGASAAAPRGVPALDLAASVVVLSAAQAVWNVPPVVLTSRSPDVAAAAGFAALAVVLRAPVVLFPGVQAMLLPRLSARPDTAHRVPPRAAAVLLGLAVVWLVGAVTLAPLAVRLGVGDLPLPGTPVVAALAVATVVGAVAQASQTALVAQHRQRPAALVWVAAILALTVLVVLPPPSPTAAATALLTGVVVAAAGFAAAPRVAARRAGSAPAR